MCTGIVREYICRTPNCGMREDGSQTPYRIVLIPTAMCLGSNELTYTYCKWYKAESDHIRVYRFHNGRCDGCWEEFYGELNEDYLRIRGSI